MPCTRDCKVLFTFVCLLAAPNRNILIRREFSPTEDEDEEDTPAAGETGDDPPGETAGPKPLKSKKGKFARVSAGTLKKHKLSKSQLASLNALSKTVEVTTGYHLPAP